MIENILSIDVEEIFHIEYLNNSIEKSHYRSIENLPPILDLLGENDISATFFIVGEIAEKYPEILRMIEEEGHEIAFHGWCNTPLWDHNFESFSSEVEKFLSIYPNCRGYRAPFFSINKHSGWVLRVLENFGFDYDSSVFPVKTPLYGSSNAPLHPYKPSKNQLFTYSEKGIMEFPLLVYSILGFRIPAAGGFYLRTMPSLVDRSIRSRNNEGYPGVIYIHNWELDPETPKINLGFYRNFITYWNIDKSVKFLKKILKDFNFTSFKRYLIDNKI